MTELEKMTYAKLFIDKLANGINPLDNSMIPENEVINNVRLSRCLFYVSDVLSQVIDNGGITPSPAKKEKKAKKQPYFLSPEQAESFEYSAAPIPLSEILKRIIAVGPTEGVKKFPRSNLQKWLLSLGLIEEVTLPLGSKMKRPTPQGEDMGIHLETRQGAYGEYYVMLYNLDAQHFIIDNLEAVVSLDGNAYRAKMNLDNQGKPWDEAQDSRLVELFRSGCSLQDIAAQLKRGEAAVRIRLRKNGIDPDSIILQNSPDAY